MDSFELELGSKKFYFVQQRHSPNKQDRDGRNLCRRFIGGFAVFGAYCAVLDLVEEQSQGRRDGLGKALDFFVVGWVVPSLLIYMLDV